MQKIITKAKESVAAEEKQKLNDAIFDLHARSAAGATVAERAWGGRPAEASQHPPVGRGVHLPLARDDHARLVGRHLGLRLWCGYWHFVGAIWVLMYAAIFVL